MRLVRNGKAHAENPARENGAGKCRALIFRVLAETDGDAAVLHAGDVPYLEGPAGVIALARQRLTDTALEALARHLLPDEAHQALNAGIAVLHHHPPIAALPNHRFTIVAAQQANDLWIEIRHVRTRTAAEQPPAVRPRRRRATPRPDDESLTVPSAEELWDYED